MNIKPRPNQHRYVQALQEMSPEQRLIKALELTEMAKELFLSGLRNLWPDKTEVQYKKLDLGYMYIWAKNLEIEKLRIKSVFKFYIEIVL